MLHTAAYFGCTDVVQELLQQGLDVNLLDYKGATGLHRARDVPTMKVYLHSQTLLIKVSDYSIQLSLFWQF